MLSTTVSDTLVSYRDAVPGLLALIAVLLAFVVAMWHLLNWMTPFDDMNEIVRERNWAYAARRIALCLAQVVAMAPAVALFDPEAVGASLLRLISYGAWATMALFGSTFVIDAVVLPRVNNVEAMRQGNLAVGLVEAGFFVSVGLLINGSLTDEASTGWLFWASSAVFFLLGLGFVVAVFWLHEFLTPYQVREGLAAGHLSSAVEVFGVLVSTSLVTRVAVAGDFTSWGTSLVLFAVVSLLSVVLLYAFRFLIDVAILTGTTMKQVQLNDEVVAATVMSSLLIVVALVVSTTVHLHL